jgi:hypothetical protein
MLGVHRAICGAGRTAFEFAAAQLFAVESSTAARRAALRELFMPMAFLTAIDERMSWGRSRVGASQLRESGLKSSPRVNAHG